MNASTIIAHVNVAKGYRGGERQTELLVRCLLGVNLRQVLIARRGAPLARRFPGVDVEIREVSGNPLSVALATDGVDLVHVHEGRSVYGAYLRSLWSKTPYLITRRVNNPIGNHWWAHQAYRRARCVAAVATPVAAIVRKYDPTIRVRVVHSGSSSLSVDRERVTAIKGVYPNKFLICHVGALDNEQKGQQYIIDAASVLQGSHPDIHFLLVGGGDDEATLKAAADGLPNLSFTGFVDNVGDYLAAADIFILPSNKEGIGSILFDAMEQRLPIVASRVGGVPEIVQHEENGLLIDPRSTAQLIDAILRLYGDPKLRRALGARGAEIAGSFTADAMCRKYLDLYEEILGPYEPGPSS